jgi:hypothetical protein
MYLAIFEVLTKMPMKVEANWKIVLQVLDELLYPYWGYVWSKETEITEEIKNVSAISIPNLTKRRKLFVYVYIYISASSPGPELVSKQKPTESNQEKVRNEFNAFKQHSSVANHSAFGKSLCTYKRCWK